MKGFSKYYLNLLKIIIGVSLPSFLFFSCTTQSDSTIKASITINKDENAEAYNPMIFGGFDMFRRCGLDYLQAEYRGSPVATMKA